MKTVKDALEIPSSPDPSSPPVRPLERLKSAEEFAAICQDDRFGAVLAAEEAQGGVEI